MKKWKFIAGVAARAAPISKFLIIPDYSLLIDSTGLAREALTDWYEIVAYPIKKTITIEMTKVKTFIPVL